MLFNRVGDDKNYHKLISFLSANFNIQSSFFFSWILKPDDHLDSRMATQEVSGAWKGLLYKRSFTW